MSVRINLAPEVYQASQRSKRLRHLATTIGVLVCGVSIGLVILGFLIVGSEKVAILKIQGDIKTKQDKVRSYADLQEAATAQQHLDSLEKLYGQTGNFSKFFEVLQTFAPQGIAVSTVVVGEDNKIEMSGSARSFDLVTKLAKALEGSNRTVGPNAAQTQEPYFTDIQFSSVTKASGTVDFRLTANMSPEVTSGN